MQLEKLPTQRTHFNIELFNRIGRLQSLEYDVLGSKPEHLVRRQGLSAPRQVRVILTLDLGLGTTSAFDPEQPVDLLQPRQSANEPNRRPRHATRTIGKVQLLNHFITWLEWRIRSDPL
jgi:hypothetical protein